MTEDPKPENWHIFWDDGTDSIWPCSCWTAEQLLKLTGIVHFELAEV